MRQRGFAREAWPRAKALKDNARFLEEAKQLRKCLGHPLADSDFVESLDESSLRRCRRWAAQHFEKAHRDSGMDGDEIVIHAQHWLPTWPEPEVWPCQMATAFGHDVPHWRLPPYGQLLDGHVPLDMIAFRLWARYQLPESMLWPIRQFLITGQLKLLEPPSVEAHYYPVEMAPDGSRSMRFCDGFIMLFPVPKGITREQVYQEIPKAIWQTIRRERKQGWHRRGTLGRNLRWATQRGKQREYSRRILGAEAKAESKDASLSEDAVRKAMERIRKLQQPSSDAETEVLDRLGLT